LFDWHDIEISAELSIQDLAVTAPYRFLCCMVLKKPGWLGTLSNTALNPPSFPLHYFDLEIPPFLHEYVAFHQESLFFLASQAPRNCSNQLDRSQNLHRNHRESHKHSEQSEKYPDSSRAYTNKIYRHTCCKTVCVARITFPPASFSLHNPPTFKTLCYHDADLGSDG